MLKRKIKTKFGTATINSDGYYEISSVKEGNHDKILHRLIYEDFYNVKLSVLSMILLSLSKQIALNPKNKKNEINCVHTLPKKMIKVVFANCFFLISFVAFQN